MFNDTNIQAHISSHGIDLSEHKPTAAWMISEWSDIEWILEATGDEARLVEGVLHGIVRINFEQRLPNGRLLTDKKYAVILEDIKRAVFFARAGVYGSEISRAEGLSIFSRNLISFVNFMMIEGLDKPETLFNFSSLTQSHFEAYCRLAVDGTAGIECHATRIRNTLESLSQDELSSIRLPDGHIDRAWLEKQTHISAKVINQTPETIILLRDFEACKSYPEYTDSKNNRSREYPSNRMKTISMLAQKKTTESRVADLISVWKKLQELEQYLQFPLKFDPFNNNSIHKHKIISCTSLALFYGATPNGRTPTIPIDIAFHYLENAIEWVVSYGPELVQYKNTLDAQLTKLMDGRKARRDHFAPQAFKLVPIPDKLKALNIKRYNYYAPGTNNRKKREELSVDDAIDCLIACCFILIGTFVARRRLEILFLDDESVVPGPDGWDIVFGARKVSATHKLSSLVRPIPDLVYDCSKLLLDLYPTARKNCPDDVLKRRLFVRKNGSNKILAFTQSYLFKILDLFSDIIEVPIDKDGKRWYLRPHELRRFFAMAYFWHRRYHDLHTLSWFMGHIDPEETRRYITEMFGTMELDQEEARYIVNAIRSGINAGNDWNDFHNHIQQRFNTKNVRLIDPSTLQVYIEQLIEKDCLDIRINSLETSPNSSEEIFVQFIEPDESVCQE